MNCHEIAANLCRKAAKLGLDNPTEGMISEMLCDIQSDILENISHELSAAGFPSMADRVAQIFNDSDDAPITHPINLYQAAPEMLAALKMARDALQSELSDGRVHLSDPGAVLQSIEVIDIAMSKAEGGGE